MASLQYYLNTTIYVICPGALILWMELVILVLFNVLVTIYFKISIVYIFVYFMAMSRVCFLPDLSLNKHYLN